MQCTWKYQVVLQGYETIPRQSLLQAHQSGASIRPPVTPPVMNRPLANARIQGGPQQVIGVPNHWIETARGSLGVDKG